jgi:hypothetical protein
MKSKLKIQFLALLLVLSLGVLTGLEPTLHNHDLDYHGEHEDCSSCNWTQINIYNTASQTVAILQSYEESTDKTPASKPSVSLASTSLSRAPPSFF